MSYARYATLITRALNEADRHTGPGALDRYNRNHYVTLAEYLWDRLVRAGY